MNIQELNDTIVSKHAKHAADLMDGASFAYVTELLRHIKVQGKDPADYEVVIARDEFPLYTEDKDGTRLKVDYRIRLERRKDIENLPVIGNEDD